MSDELTADAAAPKTTGGASNSFEEPWPVAQLSENLAAYIKRLGTVWVEGELTKPSVKGSTFFGELRDLREDMAVAIHSFNAGSFPSDLVNGDRVAVLVKPEFWKKSGKMSMQIQELRKVGLGELLERIQRLRDKLTAEGLTDPARKQPLPFLPNCIGLITGKDSDAEKDVLRNAQLRWPSVRFRVVHAAVQGERAVSEVLAGIFRVLVVGLAIVTFRVLLPSACWVSVATYFWVGVSLLMASARSLMFSAGVLGDLPAPELQ